MNNNNNNISYWRAIDVINAFDAFDAIGCNRAIHAIGAIVPATKCQRISPEELERQRRSLGSMFFRQEFNCEFVETIDQVFNYDMVKAAFDKNVKPLF